MIVCELRDCAKRYDGRDVLRGAALQVEQGELFGIAGRSGAGKTTLLRIVAGLEKADSGEAHLGGQIAASASRWLAPERRGVAMVFQTLGLWPHLTAFEHLDLVLRRRFRNRGEREAEAVRLLNLVEIGELAGRAPGQMSGGERQRLALARALACRAKLLLLDEPFAHLDAPLREAMATRTREWLAAEGATAILVSHDGPLLASICDRLAILDGGRIAQCGPPSAVYGAPLCVAAALACGPAFFVEGEARQGLARTAVGDFPLRDGGAGGPGRVCARPETFSLSPMQDADKNNAEAALLARIERSAFLAGRWKTHFWIKGQAFWTWTDGPLAPGELARARLEAAAWIPQETRE